MDLRSGITIIFEQIQHEILETPATVYNFEVEDWHTYYVSESAVFVHNQCGMNNLRKTIAGKITGYTCHGLAQAMGRDGGRGVKSSAILNTVRNPIKVILQAEGKIKYVGKQAVVILNKAGKVVTTYAKSSRYWR